MSLYIQPSFTEGMPRSLLEAMSMGCPVMGSSVGGIPDVVSKDLLHKKGDYKTIAKQIERLCFNREILKKESIIWNDYSVSCCQLDSGCDLDYEIKNEDKLIDYLKTKIWN